MASFSITTGVALILMHCPIEGAGTCTQEEAQLPPLASVSLCWSEAREHETMWDADGNKITAYCVERDYRHPVVR